MSTLRYLTGLAICALAAAGCDRAAHRPTPPEPTRGLILVSLDALRADRLGVYGHEQPTSPFLDSLAARGALFERALAQYPSTLASHLTMFTGLYPQEHGVYRPERYLDERIETIPERLRANGFRTAGSRCGQMRRCSRGLERNAGQPPTRSLHRGRRATAPPRAANKAPTLFDSTPLPGRRSPCASRLSLRDSC